MLLQRDYSVWRFSISPSQKSGFLCRLLLIEDGGTDYGDTVAYIPNAQLDSAEDTINKLFAKGDFDQIYKMFETAFQFIPCTGDDFKEMKANGAN